MCIVPQATSSVKIISTTLRDSVNWRTWLLSLYFLKSLKKVTHIARSNRPQVDQFICPVLYLKEFGKNQ